MEDLSLKYSKWLEVKQFNRKKYPLKAHPFEHSYEFNVNLTLAPVSEMHKLNI